MFQSLKTPVLEVVTDEVRAVETIWPELISKLPPKYRSSRQDMALKLRRTGLSAGIDKDRPDYTIVTGEWEIGRIYETRGGPDNLRWFWSLTVNGPMTRSDKVATLEEAKAQFQKSWDKWKAWAKLTM
jgi:hypothetical protein